MEQGGGGEEAGTLAQAALLSIGSSGERAGLAALAELFTASGLRDCGREIERFSASRA